MDFNPNLFDELFGDVPTVIAAQPKRRIRAYSPEYYEWIGATTATEDDDIFAPMPDMEAKAAPKFKVLTAFRDMNPNYDPHAHLPMGLRPMPALGEQCNGSCMFGFYFIRNSGVWINCARCGGHGVMALDEISRGHRYSGRKASGQRMDIKFTHHIH